MSDVTNEAEAASPGGILVEAEEFDDHGGWVVDSQFEVQMGSPYLLAHGLGRPVDDAQTTVAIDEAGEYEVWVRAKDWVPSHHPGRFSLVVNGETLETELGANGQDWSWQSAGVVELAQGDVTLALQDLTGFDGRCDAIYLSRDGSVPVDGAGEDARAWRKRLRGLPAEPVDAGTYDVVVVGGGMAGCAAALTAARFGCRVALVQDRPVLGGNASKEIGLSPRGESGDLLRELSERSPDGDIAARRVLEAEPNVSLFLERRVYDLATEGAKIVSIDVRESRTGAESRLAAPIFIDCTGAAILGRMAGAETLSGQEGRDDYGEPTAPEQGDDMHHGNTLFFRTRMAEGPVSFPEVPWATEVAKDYANLSGQLTQPGVENAPGPKPGQNPADDPVFDFSAVAPGVNPMMVAFPATHFWEYGQWLDLYTQGEEIRDYLLRALYGTFSNVKRLDPENYANLELEWIAHVAAQGEFDRYEGDHVLTETDIRDHTEFGDAVVRNDGAFCLHYPNQPGEGDYDFRLRDWVWDVRDHKPYAIPFRCLYSTNIENLMMAGKHISVTHVAGSSTKLMGNGAQHGAAVGTAAFLCTKHATTPRGIYDDHLDELRDLTTEITGCGHLHLPAGDPERGPSARQVAERHAQDVVDGNLERATADFHGNALTKLVEAGALPPKPTSTWEILSEQPGIEYVDFHVRYANDTDTVELKARWLLIAGRWRIIETTKIDTVSG